MFPAIKRYANDITQAKPKKNIETDLVGDKMGRVHLGRQDLSQLQTRKMKGLKRSRDAIDDMNGVDEDDIISVDGDDEEEGGVALKRSRAE